MGLEIFSCVKYKTDCYNTEWNPWGHWCVKHNTHTVVGLCAPSACGKYLSEWMEAQPGTLCESVGAPAWFWVLMVFLVLGVVGICAFCVYKNKGGYSAM